MPYVDPWETFSDGEEISGKGDLVEEDVPNDVGPMEFEVNNDGDDTLLSMMLLRRNDQLTLAGFFRADFEDDNDEAEDFTSNSDDLIYAPDFCMQAQPLEFSRTLSSTDLDELFNFMLDQMMGEDLDLSLSPAFLQSGRAEENLDQRENDELQEWDYPLHL
ncbi:MAG: hypothetical protein Q9192_001073 [Flavoplaca navasiana]